MKKTCLALTILALAAFASDGLARSSHSPRHSGMDSPYERSHAPMRGFSHQDAYGNTLTDRIPESSKPRTHRPRAGAYGGRHEPEPRQGLPEGRPEPPAWNYGK